MSSETQPISPARFADAIKDLSLASLHLKVLEIRNDVAHLDYSNEQLLPYAKGTVAALGATPSESPEPDQDCIDAIKENLVVIERKLNQLRLVRAEVENRGVSWTEFQSKEEAEQEQVESDQRAERTGSALAAARQPTAATNGHTATTTNGHAGAGSTAATTTTTAGNPWTDGTFQTGTIRNGEVQMDSIAGQSFASRNTGGGSLTDEQLQQALEERLGLSSHSGSANGINDDDEEGGLHL
ncbi:hypothetical protein HMPREF1624_08346 [Sporothrix schenckii ATCC 58251]|uniref:Secondary alcohol dehydrogenase n=1 Tax=Sporothrix schenckii (strain ATCC 58251 / de Perez 2211183) TaxID=1391915 RepID=U7PJN6_SPOS1|nr:hypothetical protein HMPREF1624_08346 [Sporothrix schenckii ATCC 58251]